jgi:hypothetical protein
MREVSGRTKPRSTALRNPSLILFLLHSLSHTAASDSERPMSGGGESIPEAPTFAPRWCVRPPLGGRTTVEWPQWRHFTSARTDEVKSVEISPTQRSRARPHVDSRWSGSTRAARRSTTRRSAADGDCEGVRVSPKPYSSSSVLLLPQPQICVLARLWYQCTGSISSRRKIHRVSRLRIRLTDLPETLEP